MIKNIVFDLGGVLLTWNPVELVDQVFAQRPKEERPYEIAKVTSLPGWKEMNCGKLDVEHAKIRLLKEFIDQYPGQESKFNELGGVETVLCKFLDELVDYIWQIPRGIAILEKVRQFGYKTFALSNYGMEYFNVARSRYDWFEGFDGYLISFESQDCKPNLEFFESFLGKFALDPSECIFIDDKDENIIAASRLGMMGIVCSSLDQVELELENLGIFSSLKAPIPSPRILRASIPEYVTGDFKCHAQRLPGDIYGLCLDSVVKACVDIALIHSSSDCMFLGNRNYHPQKDWWIGCGGRMIPGETPQTAALRILERELGIKEIPALEYLGSYSHSWAKRHQPPEDNGTADIVVAMSVVVDNEHIANLKISEEYCETKWERIDILADDEGRNYHGALCRLAKDIRCLRRKKRLIFASQRSSSSENDIFLAKQARIYTNSLLDAGC